MDSVFQHSAVLARRKALGLSQRRLAELAHTTQQHISLIERGRLEPNLRTWSRLCAALGWDIAPRPRQAGIGARLSGLARFNAWEAREEDALGADEAFRRAGELALLRRGWAAAPEGEDWAALARAWVERRRRLPRRLS